MSSSTHDLASLAACLLIAPLFIVFGFEKITGYASSVGYMEAYGQPGILLPLAIIAELGGGLAILFGFFLRWAALAGGLLLLAVNGPGRYAIKVRYLGEALGPG